MKTIKTTAKKIVLSLILSLTISVTACASPRESLTNLIDPFYPDAEIFSLLELNREYGLILDGEFGPIDNKLREEGILECENSEVIVVLDQNDEIVYQGSHELEDENCAFVTRLLTKADFIMYSGGQNFYKVF